MDKHLRSVSGYGYYSPQPLDRDPPHGRAQWSLRVTATDGELEAHTDVRVNVKDVNDNAPFFPSRTTTAAVSEDTPKGKGSH